MAKFFGKIGYAQQVQISPGVWADEITEKEHIGELARNTSNTIPSDNLNDDLNIANEISIIADPYASQNFHSMRYVEWMGAKWKIKSARVEYPRIILTIGGIYKCPKGQNYKKN